MTTSELLAAEFSREIRAALTPAELKKVRFDNLTEPRAGVCHTHDFIDANEAMADAFTTTIGRAPDTNSDDDLVLWNEAWDIAKARGFRGRK